MKKMIILLALTVIVTLSLNYCSQRKDGVALNSTKVETVPTKKKREALKNTRYKLRKISRVINGFPKECRAALKDISYMINNEYQNLTSDPSQINALFDKECRYKLSINTNFKKIIENTKCDIFNMEEVEDKYKCIAALFNLKAHFIAEQSSLKPVGELSTEELKSHLIKMFFNFDNLNLDKMKSNVKVLDRLYELHSNDPQVIEAYIGYLTIGKQITQYDGADERVNDVLSQNKGLDMRIDRLEVIRAEIRGDREASKKAIDRMEKDYPNQAEVAYYKSAYYWKGNNKGKAIEYVNRAIAQSSSCTYCTPKLYKDTKERLLKAKRGEKDLYSISLSLNFDNL